jgi:hypothetical protein
MATLPSARRALDHSRRVTGAFEQQCSSAEGPYPDKVVRVGTPSAAKAVDQQTAPVRSAARPMPRWADPAAVALYLALAFWVTSGLWRHIGALALVNGGSDAHFFEWMLVHATRIFTHSGRSRTARGTTALRSARRPSCSSTS